METLLDNIRSSDCNYLSFANTVEMFSRCERLIHQQEEPLQNIAIFLLYYKFDEIPYYIKDKNGRYNLSKESSNPKSSSFLSSVRDEKVLMSHNYGLFEVLVYGYENCYWKIDDISQSTAFSQRFSFALNDFIEWDNQTSEAIMKRYELSSNKEKPKKCLKTAIDICMEREQELIIEHAVHSQTNNSIRVQALTTENAQLKAEITQLKEQLAKAQQVTPASGEELTGLSKVNADIALAKAIACKYADTIWKMDKTESIKTGVMAEQVRAFLNDIMFDLLPDHDENLKKWFADVRPDYAIKSGRTSKNAPTEIPLTMKL